MTLVGKVSALRASVRFRLVCLVLAGVMPISIAASLLVYLGHQQKRNAICQGMLATTRNYSAILDDELEDIQKSLQALAQSSSLVSGDMSCLRNQTILALVTRQDADIILADETGQQQFNSYLPPGSPLPKRNVPDRVKLVFETGEKSISGLFRGAVTGRHLISIDVPVFRDGRVLYDLAMTLPVDSLTHSLSLPTLPSEWTATILDHEGVVVARSDNQSRHVGSKPETPNLASSLRMAPAGVFEAVGLAGVPVLAGYCRSAASGWTIVVSVPKALVERELWIWLYGSLAGTGLLGLFGAAMALRLGNGLSTSLKDLATSASALGRGEIVSLRGMDCTETREVARSLSETSALLRRREDELRQSNQTAHQRSALLDATLTSIAEGLIVLDAKGLVQRLNERARAMFAILEEGAPIPGDDLPAMTTGPGDAPLALGDVPGFRALRGETVEGEEICFQRPGEKPFWLSVNAAPIRTSREEIVGSVVTFQDITRRKLAETFRSDVERIIRHDIRSPLASIHAMLEFAIRVDLEKGFRERAHDILQAVGQVLKLVDASEKFILMEHGEYVLHKQACECGKIFESVRQSVQGLAQRRTVKLVMTLVEPGATLEGEDFLLEDMLRNLVKNAVEASPAGGIVTVKHVRENNTDRIYIHNDGKVDPGIGERFFEKYVSSGKAHGKGLGTYSANLIARAHGGRIDFVSSEEIGTMLSVMLPRSTGE